MSAKFDPSPLEGVWGPRVSGVAVRSGNSVPPPVSADWSFDLKEAENGAMMVGCVPVEDLSCVYQPIVDLSDGRPFAYEVLARCRVPGLTNPEILFKRASAERFCGLLGRTLRSIGSKGCRGVPLFLNVHPAELGDRFVIQLDDPLYAHDDDVYVEITESVPFSHYELCATMLREMRQRGGVHVVVDDLGAGYSNLKRIADLEPSIVKLDRHLVMNLDQNRRQRILVQAVVRMCVDLGAQVVAEGLESWDEVRAARDCGCHYAQGYALGRPAPVPAQPIWKL
jgi:EAL domain-containing protein (putative c-di-GMP-specific phosphodiesterase class I)